MNCPTCGAPEEVYQFCDEWSSLPDSTRSALASAWAASVKLTGMGVSKSNAAQVLRGVASAPKSDMVAVLMPAWDAQSLRDLLLAIADSVVSAEGSSAVRKAAEDGSAAGLASLVQVGIAHYEQSGGAQ
jgi:hypothetical protein